MGKANKENMKESSNSPPKESKDMALLDQEAKESPVLSLICKRLRAARKKVKRAEEIEAIRDSGKDINADQVKYCHSPSFHQAPNTMPNLFLHHDT